MKPSLNTYTASIKEVLESLSSNPETGLSASLVTEVRKAEGMNTAQSPYRTFVPLLLLSFLVPPVFLSAWFFQAGHLAAASVIFSALLLMGVGLYALVYHMSRAEKKRQQLLKSMEYSEYTVLRNGTAEKIPGKYLVAGDIIIFDRVAETIIPADCRLISKNGIKIKHSWEHAYLNGTHVNEEQEVLLAGLEVLNIDAVCVVIATGNARKIMEMYTHHPAGTLVEQVGKTGLWYLATSIVLLSGAGLLGVFPAMAFAVATGTPVLLPFFLLKKGRGLRMQNIHEVPDHIMYPLDQLLLPKPKEAVITLKDTVLPLKGIKKEPDDVRATVAQFLELLSLSVRDDEASRHGALLRKLTADAKRLGMRIDNMTDWELDTTESKTVFDPATGTYRYWNTFVMHEEGQENTLHLICNDASLILRQATYLWDAKEHTMRRRFFNGEKQKLAAMLQEHIDNGSLVYGLALREHALDGAPWIYIGAVVIPRAIAQEELETLRRYAGNNHAVVLYTESDVAPAFARDVLRIPQKHLFAQASEISFSTLRRHDFFLANRASALDIARIYNDLTGAVLVDTLQDRYVSSLYFWPRHMRFDTNDAQSFFSWLKNQVKQSRDAFTKMAQYTGLLCISAAFVAGILLFSPETDMYRVFMMAAIMSLLVGLVGICCHVTDKQTQHKKIHQLALLDPEQSMTGARILITALVTAGLYYVLALPNLTAGVLPLEFAFFLFLAVGSASLSRFASDTKSSAHALLMTLSCALVAGLAYFLLFMGNSALPEDLHLLFVAGAFLGNLILIIASYQTVPKSGL